MLQQKKMENAALKFTSYDHIKGIYYFIFYISESFYI